MDTTAILTEARELITDRARWAIQASAVTADGKSCLPNDPDATRWCAIGAVQKIVSREFDGDEWLNATQATQNLMDSCAAHAYGRDAQFVNDWVGHDAILGVIDAAIFNSKMDAYLRTGRG